MTLRRYLCLVLAHFALGSSLACVDPGAESEPDALGGAASTPHDSPQKRSTRVLAPLEHIAPVPAETDPLATHRPIDLDCNDLTGWYVEDGHIEVNTGHCNYLALSEPAALSVPKGARLTMEITHFDLTAPEPTQVHLALSIGGEVVWEKSLSIPSEAEVLELDLELPSAVTRGDPIGFHLHNHGQNTYSFGKVYATFEAR